MKTFWVEILTDQGYVWTERSHLSSGESHGKVRMRTALALYEVGYFRSVGDALKRIRVRVSKEVSQDASKEVC